MRTIDDELTDQMLRGILDDAVAASTRRKRAEADEVAVALHYAHASISRPVGDDDRERRERIASDGTPEVPEFCHLEYAARMGMRPESGFSAISVALDLHHRLPELWDLVDRLAMPVWVAKKVVHATTALSADQARALSVQLAARWPRLSPTAFLDQVKAAVLALTQPERLSSRGAGVGRPARDDRAAGVVRRGVRPCDEGRWTVPAGATQPAVRGVGAVG